MSITGRIIQKVIDRVMGNGLLQEETKASGEKKITPGMPEVIRQAAAESCILLKNDGTLPLRKEQKIAVFGRCQLDWFYVGYGSGGDVHAPYCVNLMDGLKSSGAAFDQKLADIYRTWTGSGKHRADHGWWGHWPFSHPEMRLSEELVKDAAKEEETALVVLGRAAGEDRDLLTVPGSYYLTDEESSMLELVTKTFRHTVVILNVGNIPDMRWAERSSDRISAILLVFPGGMESGNAVADVLYGKVNPCGKLPDTIAREYADYPGSSDFGNKDISNYTEGIFVGYRFFDRHPEKVLWPFGYGLSYTSFSVEKVGLDSHFADVRVKNTGERAGKEVVRLFVSQPESSLEKARKVLISFAKTKDLSPGEEEILRLSFDDRMLSSYDEARHAFILEAGEYRFFANETELGTISYPREKVLRECGEICRGGAYLKERILKNLPGEIPAGMKPVSFADVISGKAEMEDFIAGLSDKELEALSRGHGMMNSPLGVSGNTGVLGGIIPSLREKGVPAISLCDGPAGIRMQRYCSLIPCGTALAATWNTQLIEKLASLLGEEMSRRGVDVLLAPGMNIHRNPLCGRNFEYYSEDPVLSGKMAAAFVRGLQKSGHAACPKHFACNNQETGRNHNDSRVSERTLREIYLRNFEICVREAKPLAVMTSYNKINGVYAHYHYDLAATVLRKEWGYEGLVMTDWWMKSADCPEFPLLKDNAYRVRAQVDVLMPGNKGHIGKKYRSDGTLLNTLGKEGGITRAELQKAAGNTLRLTAKLMTNKKQG